MARGEGPNGVPFPGSPAAGAPPAADATLATYFPVRLEQPQPLEALVGTGPTVV
jgi:hypothetical protein